MSQMVSSFETLPVHRGIYLFFVFFLNNFSLITTSPQAPQPILHFTESSRVKLS